MTFIMLYFEDVLHKENNCWAHETHKTKTTRKKSTTLLVRCAIPFLKTSLIESRHSRVAFHFALASIGDIVSPISETHDVARCHDEIPITGSFLC